MWVATVCKPRFVEPTYRYQYLRDIYRPPRPMTTLIFGCLFPILFLSGWRSLAWCRCCLACTSSARSACICTIRFDIGLRGSSSIANRFLLRICGGVRVIKLASIASESSLSRSCSSTHSASLSSLYDTACHSLWSFLRMPLLSPSWHSGVIAR